jgi:membrane-associated protease RseP (regulator of RpoE activity)
VTFANLASFALLGILGTEALAAKAGSSAVTVSEGTNVSVAVSSSESPGRSAITIKSIEPAQAGAAKGRKELPWLGVASEETSDALTAQLNLDPGVGLVVTYVMPDSPAAKAGLQKNDVLVEFESHALAHPAQLRRLVQARKEGDAIKLAFYRAGRQQTASVTLGKTAAGFGLLDGDRDWLGNLPELRQPLRDLPIGEAVREYMKTLRDSLGHVQIDQEKVQEEIHRSLAQGHKAYQEALRHLTNANSALGPALRKALEDLAKSRFSVDTNATVTVRSSSQSVKSIVKADESGTIVIVCNPKPHLTAHDKDGNLLFDGEIETPEQRAKVPRKLWRRVEPLLDKLAPDVKDAPEAEPESSKETS